MTELLEAEVLARQAVRGGSEPLAETAQQIASVKQAALRAGRGDAPTFQVA
ncbi:hypothetical protein ACTMTI_53005 [Nonomuraea sp. H19]|uniref:hypothetical protein n=1 Tax=Nonomuraea sp. H19 TaxID=3452206 RepID=UPI003F89C339